MATVLRDLFGHLLPLVKGGDAMQELEISIRAKGNMTQEEDVTLRASMMTANVGCTLLSAATSVVSWFLIGPVNKFQGFPPLPRSFRFGICAGTGLFTVKVWYYASLQACALHILDHQEDHVEMDRMKMELAHIILTKHTDEKSLFEAVKRHFFAEHFYSDQHQDKPLFRWRQRHSYVDNTYMERAKEIEANNSEDKAKTISGQTTTSFGDLMEDPLACILGSPDSEMESNKPPEHKATILKRRDLRAQRRSHRHHHRHATL